MFNSVFSGVVGGRFQFFRGWRGAGSV